MKRGWGGISSAIASAVLAPGTVLAAALLAGRLSGLIRETIVASRYGLTGAGDLAVVLMTIPDLLVNLIISGGLSAALVPRLNQMDAADADALWRSVSLATLAVFGAFALLFAFAPALVLSPLLPGRVGELGALSRLVSGAVAISIPLAALAGLSGAYLNARNRFLTTGLGTLFFNIGLISMLLWLADPRSFSLAPLAIGVLLGAILRVGPQISSLPSKLFLERSFLSVSRDGFARQFLAAVAATTIAMLAPILIRSAASFYAPGTVAAFNYAQKLVELPVGVAFGAVNTVALTSISTAFRKGGVLAARAPTIDALQISILMSGLIAIGGWIFSSEIVALVFGYGRMSGAEQASVAALFRIAILSIPLTALALVAMTSLNACGRTTEVLKAALVAVATLPVLIACALSLSGMSGLMWAFVSFQGVLAILMAHRSGLARGGFSDSALHSFFNRRFIPLLLASWIPIGLAAIASSHLDKGSLMPRVALAAFGAIGGMLVILRETRKAQ
jgi:putative peptidoglycan lipid II flippase